MTREQEVELAWAQHHAHRPITVAMLRRRVSAEQNHRCCYCGVRTTDEPGRPHQATLEHVLPRAHGGKDHYCNVVLACFACNNARGDRMNVEPILLLIAEGC